MNMRDLAVKFTSYAYYIATREWAKEHSVLPVLVVAPDIRAGEAYATGSPGQLTRSPGVVLWTTTLLLLKEHGALASVWLRGIPPHSQVAHPDSSSQTVLVQSAELIVWSAFLSRL